MKLYPVMATGIRAYCSDLIVDPEGDTAYLMSICGYQATVKGIIANLLENYRITIKIESLEYDLDRSTFGYKVQMKSLPSGMVHAIVYPKMALAQNDEEENRFFIFSDRTDEKLELFFRHLDDKLEIPLHPSWKNWLWNTFRNQDEWFTELKTLAGNYQGYSFWFEPEDLQDLISQAFKNNVPEIVTCMKGGNGNGKLDGP